MDDCIFCKIAAGQIPADIIYEDGDTVAFLDIRPNNPGHALVIPRVHTKNIFEISDQGLETLMKTVKRVAEGVRVGMKADGVNIAMNNEPAAGQVVFHTHMHIIPRFTEDGYKHWPHKEYSEGESARVAERIRKSLS